MSHDMISEFREELHRIADWWLENAQDEKQGGFIGEITVDNLKVEKANKGVILNTRILWFFSEVSIFTGNDKYKELALRAYDYLVDNFLDREFGGVFWELDFKGACVDSRKQIYAQAFAIYGLSAFYRLTGNEDALSLARELFSNIENFAHDDEKLGYIEALDQKWQALDDMRLSDKDMNAPKTMNTHLHILEAYTALYIASPSTELSAAIKKCLRYFSEFIIDKENYHLRMFQAIDWQNLSDSYSYGHDIESSWLIWEAVEALGDEALTETFKPIVLKLAETALNEGLGEHGEVLDAYNFKTNVLLEERVWWVQAESLVGFYTAYELSGDQKYYDAFVKVWQFIKKYQIDAVDGEWHWLSLLDKPHVGDCKIGFWKAPYHNGRAMMEVCKLMAKQY